MAADEKTLQDLRRDAGLTQMQVATAIGTTPSHIADWERGRAMPSAKYLRPLAKALDVSVDELLDAAEESVRLSRAAKGTETA